MIRTSAPVAAPAAGAWEELVTTALLGTDRRMPPGGVPGLDAPVALLDAAALQTVRRRAGLRPYSSHHAHALHSPYWWLKCAFGDRPGRDRDPLPVRAYHQLLVWDITRRPLATRLAERVLDPLLGKSFAAYATKPSRRETA